MGEGHQYIWTKDRSTQNSVVGVVMGIKETCWVPVEGEIINVCDVFEI